MDVLLFPQDQGTENIVLQKRLLGIDLKQNSIVDFIHAVTDPQNLNIILQSYESTPTPNAITIITSLSPYPSCYPRPT